MSEIKVHVMFLLSLSQVGYDMTKKAAQDVYQKSGLVFHDLTVR